MNPHDLTDGVAARRAIHAAVSDRRDDLIKGRAEVGLAVVQTFFADETFMGTPSRERIEMLPSAFTTFRPNGGTEPYFLTGGAFPESYIDSGYEQHCLGTPNSGRSYARRAHASRSCPRRWMSPSVGSILGEQGQ